ncbi:myb-like protein G [Lucilia cuprina]|uniref:myb-like protein G n=1 Tax=Lucilia cuprina TaxID=7375 RepID=UPI000C71B3D9|nr:myb-like protein G [Lucilia cuprina]
MTDLGESQDYTDKSEESTDTEENTTELIKSFSDFKDIPKMTSIEEKTKFISMCSNIIRENFDGNPLSLNSFIDKINLIEELTVPDLSNCLISFIKSKLDGKAREILPENITSIDQIKNTLKNRIRPDNSKVVAGRIAALQVKNNNYTDFSKNIEDLADALQRSLVIEGITTEKAQEMVIEQTVSICRNNAKSDMVKAILASTVFKEPKDVVAKLIIEESTNQKEYQVLAIGHRNTKSFIRSNQNNTYNKNNGYRGQNNSYGRNKAYRGQNNSHYNRNNSYYNQNNNNNLNKYNNFRGRNFNNRGKYHNNSGNQGAFVRTLNAQAPQHEVLREEEGQM